MYSKGFTYHEMGRMRLKACMLHQSVQQQVNSARLSLCKVYVVGQKVFWFGRTELVQNTYMEDSKF